MYVMSNRAVKLIKIHIQTVFINSLRGILVTPAHLPKRH